VSKLKKEGKKIFGKINFKSKISEAKARFIETLDLPQELSNDFARITMIENSQILIEGKNNIVDYYDNYIKIQTKNVYIVLDGKSLNINEISDSEVLVSGNLNNVGFINR
jgi:sporulation protein YqfC